MPDYHALICQCGSLRFQRELVMFPLQWKATCESCGRLILICTLKPGPKARRWIEGAFDANTRWVPGHFE